MKKILLLLALVMMSGAVNAKIDRLYANFQTVGNGNISWDSENKKFTITGDENYKGGNNTYQMFAFDAGSLSNYKKIHINITNCSKTRVLFMNGSTTVYTWGFSFNGVKDKNISEIGMTADQISSITSIRIGGPATGGSLVETPIEIEIDPAEVYLETAEYECMEISTTLDEDATVTSPFQWYTSTNGEAKIEITSGNLTKQFNTAGQKEILSRVTANLGWGNGFIDITGYDLFSVNIDEFSNDKDDQVRLLQATGEKATTNFDISVTKAGSTTTSLATLTTPWISGIWTKQYTNNSQSVTSFVFSKHFASASTTPFNIAASTSSDVNYDRTFAKDRKSTVCLPFALTAEEVDAAGKFYELKDYDGATLTFKLVTTTEAYKPYLFEAKETGTPFSTLSDKSIVASSGAETSYTTTENSGYTATFNGVLAHQSVNGYYGWNSADGVFKKATSDKVTIDAFRAYITVSGTASARSLNAFFSDEETTGIQSVNTVQEKNNMIYNMAGQRVSANHKGLVIKGGKKFFLK